MRLRAWVDRHAGAILGGILALVLALASFLGNLALDVRELKAQVGPPPHVLVDSEQVKTDHDLLIRIDARVDAIGKAMDELRGIFKARVAGG